MSLRVPWLADVLRAAGLPVVEQAGWKELRPTYNLLSMAGAPKELAGIVAHHTASPTRTTLATNLQVVTYGNGVAPGPIAQLMLWRDGTYYCIAAGKANHAGAGGPYDSWLPAGTGNDRMLGIEACNDGIGEPWAPVMVESYARGVAAILDHLGLDSSRTITHHEWAPTRKIDPAGPTSGMVATLPKSSTWDGDAWRALVRDRFPKPPDPPVEADMAMFVKCDDGTAAGFSVAGILAAWIDNMDDLLAAQANGQLSTTVNYWPRTGFKNLRLVGKVPPGYTAADFREVVS